MKNARQCRRLKGHIIREYAFRLQRKAPNYGLNRRSAALKRLIEVFDEQRIDPLEAPRQFIATSTTFTLVVFEVVRFQ
jgi:hypothetical protein